MESLIWLECTWMLTEVQWGPEDLWATALSCPTNPFPKTMRKVLLTRSVYGTVSVKILTLSHEEMPCQ